MAMEKDLIEDICDIEYKVNEISNLTKILADSVENNDNAYYLLTYVEFLDSRIQELICALDQYSLKVGKIIVK